MSTKDLIKLTVDQIIKSSDLGKTADLKDLVDSFFKNEDALAKEVIKSTGTENEMAILNSAVKSDTVEDVFPRIQNSMIEKGVYDKEYALTAEMTSDARYPKQADIKLEELKIR